MKLILEEVKDAAKSNPLKSMLEFAKDFGISDRTVCRTIKKAEGKSLVRVERPLLTPAMKETHIQCCKALLNDLKKAIANQVIIFYI